MKFALVLVLTAGTVAFGKPDTPRGQLAAPGASGVVMGHLHLTATDAAASRTFWTALGAVAIQNGSLQLLQLPGTFVMVRGGQPAGGTAGSTIDHVTFRVRDLGASTALWAKSGIVVTAGAITTADGIVIQLVGDKALTEPVRMGTVTIATVAPEETRAWYARSFGAEIPGVHLEFTKAATAPAPTKGRALDHIGFDVKGLEAFCQKLDAAGVKLDRPYTKLPNSDTAIAFLTDPWGTYIELTENLAPSGAPTDAAPGLVSR